MLELVLLSVVLCFIASLLLYFGFVRKSTEVKEDEPRHRPMPNRVRDGAPRRAQMIRNRGARLRANVAAQAQESDEDNGAVGDDEPEVDPADLKMGAKKRAKLEAKAEKKAQREADELVRSDKKKREQQADEERRKLEEKERAEERRREDEERRSREEHERREHEEYLRMKEAFSVEEEGFEEGEDGDEKNLLQEFVGYIKDQKVVIVEDLAARFRLKTQAAIDRIRDLQNDNILSGVLDDRGKFIYVSQEEMEAVAKFIRQRGRVSIQELAENSNQLINLTPTVSNVN